MLNENRNLEMKNSELQAEYDTLKRHSAIKIEDMEKHLEEKQLEFNDLEERFCALESDHTTVVQENEKIRKELDDLKHSTTEVPCVVCMDQKVCKIFLWEIVYFRIFKFKNLTSLKNGNCHCKF